jgi:hypothetical protein
VKDIVKKGEQTIPCSAIDYHVLYDTHGTQLKGIRGKLTLATPKDESNDTQLYNRPYVVSSVDEVMQMAGEQADLRTWLDAHHWAELNKRVQALLAKNEDDRRELPNSQMHALREGLFMGKDGANAQYQLIRKRYSRIDEIAAFGDTESLFWQDAITKCHVTGLLDAMDAADFWGKPVSNDKQPEEVQP